MSPPSKALGNGVTLFLPSIETISNPCPGVDKASTDFSVVSVVLTILVDSLNNMRWLVQDHLFKIILFIRDTPSNVEAILITYSSDQLAILIVKVMC